MDKPVIIVRKVKRGGHGAHGGAWKVAYADFVTAMMAFFLVMWLVGQSKGVKASIASYFRDPGVFEHDNGKAPIAGGDLHVDPMNHSEPLPADTQKLEDAERQLLEQTAKRIRQQLAENPALKKLEKQIEIQITREGLRIELLEGDEPTFFASGSAALTPGTERVLALIARELGTLKNPVVVEGHTDSRPYAAAQKGGYSNWELSADRANAARRAMEKGGLFDGQVHGIRGYADTSLRVKENPLDPHNRRVTVIVQHLFKESELPAALRSKKAAQAQAQESAAPPANPVAPGPPTH
jgi:chemotaxis protein MotB